MKDTVKEEKKEKKTKTKDVSLDKLNEAYNKISELEDKLIRQSADMVNYRKRKEEEINKMLKFANEDIIKEMLPIIDNFERAIQMDDTDLEDQVSKFLSGFKMIYGNLSSTLQGYEIVAMDVLNKPFDPNTMEAVLVEEVEGVEPNIVIDVMQKGYIYKGKVIRHAMVKVSK